MNYEQSLPAALLEAARRNPDRGITVLDSRGRRPSRRTLGEIHDSARRAALGLAALGIAPGDRVIVAVPTSWAWFDAWFGVLHLGALPISMAPAAALGAGSTQRLRVESIAGHVGCKGAIVTPALKVELADSPALPVVLDTDELARLTPAPGGLPARAVQPTDTAFLQLTSGSTGRQRAVQVSHRAAVHNLLAMDDRIGAPLGGAAHEVFDFTASWLPLYHDMGLLSVMEIMSFDQEGWLCPPQAFVGRPRVWLDSFSQGKTTLTVGPNFGYQLCVERIGEADAADIHLGSCKSALVGAEMVRADTLNAFGERFGGSGFDRGAWRSCYGLAEATLLVAMDREGQGHRTAAVPAGAQGGWDLEQVVCNGPPVIDTEVVIAGPNGQPLPEGTIGEVQVNGPGVFSGYYNDPEATAECLVDGRLRTGDLGFLLQGELYLTGRTKDLLIVRGQNIMPHELEWLAEEVTGGGGSARAVAFTVARGPQGEEVVLAVEVVERDPERRSRMADEIRVRVGREMGLPLADVVFVKRGRIPKTSSGKVQRGEVRQKYLDGSLAAPAAELPV